jgi:hypothetical protein
VRSRTACLLLIVVTSSACGGGERFVQRDTTSSFALDTKAFWSLPFPSDLRREEDGTFNLLRYRTPRNGMVDAWLKTADERLTDGWGLTPGAFFTFSGDLDPKSFPSSPAATLEPSASVYLVDIDPDSPEQGRRFPLEVTFTAQGGVTRPDRLLALVPVFGFVRRANTLYAAVITDAVRDVAGEPVGRSPEFHQAFVGGKDAPAEAVRHLQPLRTWAQSQKLEVSKIVNAAVFRTMDPSRRIDRLAAFAESLPPPQLVSGWEQANDYPDFVVLTATWRVPKVQAGDRPGHGAIVWDAEGDPVKTGDQDARLVLAVPKRPMPEAGFPLMMYLHGSGGQAFEGIDRGPEHQDGPPPRPDAPPGTGPASYLAKRSIGLLGFDFPLHGTRKDPPDTSGLQFYSLFGKLEETYNIRQTVDNMPVAVMEVVYLSRLLEGLRIPVDVAPGLDAGGAADGMLRFDTARLTAMGHSMGSTLGIPVAGVDPRIDGWVFSGAGGMLIEVANSATYPVDLKFMVEQLLEFPAGEHISRDHPLLHLFQHLWDEVDPVARAHRVAWKPLPSRGPRPYLMYAGVVDGYFHPLAEQAAAVSLGGPLVGASVEDTLPAAMSLAERPQVSYPLSGNLNNVTAGVVQQAAPFELGHYVVFDTAEAQSQYLCFVQGVGTPAGPRIVSPRGVDDDCD